MGWDRLSINYCIPRKLTPVDGTLPAMWLMELSGYDLLYGGIAPPTRESNEASIS